LPAFHIKFYLCDSRIMLSRFFREVNDPGVGSFDATEVFAKTHMQIDERGLLAIVI